MDGAASVDETVPYEVFDVVSFVTVKALCALLPAPVNCPKTNRVSPADGATAVVVMSICDHAVVGAGTMVRKSITEPGIYDGFFPSLPHREWMKNLAQFNRLHELGRTVRELKARLEAIEGKSK